MSPKAGGLARVQAVHWILPGLLHSVSLGVRGRSGDIIHEGCGSLWPL